MASVYTPGSSVSIVAPPIELNGVSPSVVGVVGTASGGPVNKATAVTGQSQQTIFGAPVARKYDGGTLVAAAAENGASSIYFTRVTDGTDTVANATISNCAISSIYTGSLYNGAQVSYAQAGKANAITVSVTLAGQQPEVFPNLPASNAAVFWAAHDNAINSGNGVLRGASNIIRSNAANSTVLPSLPSSVTLSGGTDGASGVTANSLVGADGTSKSGMYTMRNLGVQALALADADSSTTYTTQAAFGEAEHILMVAVLPASTSIANAVATIQSVGLDSNEVVLLHGDWITWDDPQNGLRKISPQGFYLGERASLNPNQSVLNKALNGIVASETSLAQNPYTGAQTDQLFAAGIDLICNPIPRGAAWGVAGGYNTSSNQAENSDAWSSMTNYLAQTFRAAGGPYVGEGNDQDTQEAVTESFSHFLNTLVAKKWLSPTASGGVPYSITCNSTNNSQGQEALGYLNVGVEVEYQGIVRFFNVSLQGGASVVVTSQAVQ